MREEMMVFSFCFYIWKKNETCRAVNKFLLKIR